MAVDRRTALRMMALAGVSGGLVACGDEGDVAGVRAAVGVRGVGCEEVDEETQRRNLETVRAGYAAIAERDVSRTLEVFAEDAVFTARDRDGNVLSQHTGREEIAKFLEPYQVTLEDAVPLGDVVSVVHRTTDHTIGKSWVCASVIQLRDGLISLQECSQPQPEL